MTRVMGVFAAVALLSATGAVGLYYEGGADERAQLACNQGGHRWTHGPDGWQCAAPAYVPSMLAAGTP